MRGRGASSGGEDGPAGSMRAVFFVESLEVCLPNILSNDMLISFTMFGLRMSVMYRSCFAM